MNTHPLLIAALVMVPAILAIVAMLWVWWAVQRVENGLHVDDGLDTRDFDVGNWPTSSRAAFPGVHAG